VLTAFVRAGGRAGARNHLLVLPSVICATRVAGEIAERVGAVSLLHQHGCSLVRDDAARTAQAFEGLACSPNVGAVLVVSLGCETVQGGTVAQEIARRGQRMEFVGIQRDGGSDAAVVAGEAVGRSLLAEIGGESRIAVPPARMVLGIEASRDDPRIAELIALARTEGATVVIGDELPWARPGAGSQQHVALVAAGCQVIVSFPALDQVATGFPTGPVVAVGGESPLQRALEADFDLQAGATSREIWDAACDAFDGAPCAAELQGRSTFALPRLAMTL
jgi:altronate dehydratase